MWHKWRANYPSTNLASAHAMFYLNAWLRSDYRSKREVYELKDIWIKKNQKFLVKGLKVREEDDEWFIRPPRILWAHYFEIEGERFSFHSYIQPKRLDKGTSDDLPCYGKELSSKEVKALPLKMPELLIAFELFLENRIPKQVKPAAIFNTVPDEDHQGDQGEPKVCHATQA